MPTTAQTHDFQGVMKYWRKRSKLSQLELALIANVSQRHISWLETGRSQPSRSMVIRLAEALDVPHRDRNAMLNCAGFADLYSESELSAPEMDKVRDILQDILKHHSPYPALVIDRYWNVMMKNSASDRLLTAVFDEATLPEFTNNKGQINLAKLSLHPNGIRRFASNWGLAGPLLFHRLKREAEHCQDPKLSKLLKQLESYIDGDQVSFMGSTPLLPVLPLQLSIGGQELEICSVISTFGTAQDVTTTELRIETFYPANEETRRFFRSFSEQ